MSAAADIASLLPVDFRDALCQQAGLVEDRAGVALQQRSLQFAQIQPL